MGSLLSKKSNTQEEVYGVYRVRAKETAVMKKVWLLVESDLPYYGSVFSTILFRNHPQYVKYFHEDNIPEFVHDARIKKKFSAVCAIVSALFIDYSRKRRQRDHLLGYIAMIHKDMQLIPEDLENFMMDLLEMLIQERPKEMTAECTVVHMRYFSGLLKRIGYFMEMQREKDLYQLENDPSDIQCGWTSLCDSPSIYGRSLEYWAEKKHYWQVRMAVWSSLDKELSEMSSFLNTKRIDNEAHHSEAIKRSFGKSPRILVAKDRRNAWLKPTRHSRSSATSSESSNNDAYRVQGNSLDDRTMIWYERCKRGRRSYQRNSKCLIPSQRMEPIFEDHSRRSIVSPLKDSMKNTKASLKLGKVHTAEVHIESDKIKGNAVKNKTIIDEARARKLRRNRKKRLVSKKNNVIYPTARSNKDEEDFEHN